MTMTTPESFDGSVRFDDGESEVRFVKQYIEEWSQEDKDLAEFVAESISGEEELPSTVVIIPVAAHVEAGNIVRALSAYAVQDTEEKFAVHLHLNWPGGYVGVEGIEASFSEIGRAKELFPHLDIRVSQMYYDEPRIGAIRRAAWNGTLLKLYKQGNHGQAIGMNHDIDVLKMSSSYVGNVQKFYSKFYDNELRPLVTPVVATQIKHAFEPEYPNISSAAYWVDLVNRLQRGSYEGGLVIPMSTYALCKGFSEDAVTHETSRFSSPRGPEPMIPGTHLTTSLRRYLDRLPEDDFRTIWTSESFGADDDCRVRPEFTDISRDELVRKVTEDATYFGLNYIDMAFGWHLSTDEEDNLVSDDEQVRELAEKTILKRIKKTERIVRFVLDSALEIPRVGSFLSSQYFTKEYIDHILYMKRLKLERNKYLMSKEYRVAWMAEFVNIEGSN